jgi:hypothetical protein
MQTLRDCPVRPTLVALAVGCGGDDAATFSATAFDGLEPGDTMDLVREQLGDVYDLPEGVVYEQDPDSLAEAYAGSTVTIKVSTGE